MGIIFFFKQRTAYEMRISDWGADVCSSDLPSGGRISSGYGMRRHPILGYKRMHAGVDFAGGYGAPIHAATDGTVTVAGRTGGFGNYVKLSHGGGLGPGYGHMSRIAVRRGPPVRRGQGRGYHSRTAES